MLVVLNHTIVEVHGAVVVAIMEVHLGVVVITEVHGVIMIMEEEVILIAVEVQSGIFLIFLLQ